jgi:hypothetical protein
MSDEFYLPEAQVIYRKVISMGNKEVLPYLGLGNIALHSGDLTEAEKWFIQARDLQAEHPAVLLAWGRLAAAKAARLKDDGEAKKELQEARALLEKSKSKGEDSATIHTELGGVYYRLACVGEGRSGICRSPAHAAAAQRFALFARPVLCPVGKNKRCRTEVSRDTLSQP